MLYSEGCKITIGGTWNQDEVVASDPAEDRRQIAEAVEVAKQADVIVLAIGGNEQTSREAWGLQHMGDRTSLDLIGRQEELVEAMVALGKPVIVVPVQRPPALHQLPQRSTCRSSSSAGIWARKPATPSPMCCSATINPGGKLPISFPRSAGHLPVFYNYKPSARRGYLFDDVSPLYRLRLRPQLHHLRIWRTRGWRRRRITTQRLDPGVRWTSPTPASAPAPKWSRCTSATWSAPSRGPSRS